MRLNTGSVRRIPGWVAGIQEDAEPASGFDRYGKEIGVLDAANNMIPTEVGRLAVRGGGITKQAFNDGLGQNVSAMLTATPFSSVGAVAVGHVGTSSKHWAFLCASDFSSVLARADMGWNSATPATNVQGHELWEKVYLCDGTLNYGTRQQMVAVDGAGTLTAITADFGSGVEAVKPYCAEVYNGNLFVAGQDSGGAADAPAMVRHALLGSDPAAPAGWSGTAYNILGAKGVRVTAMKTGDNYMLIAKQNELYRLSGYGRGLAGWQYVVQPVDNSLGVGAFNPRALAFSSGYWYGVSQAGPFRCDGNSVELMVGPRRRSWANVSDLSRCWVQPHPDRQHILFGFVTRFQGWTNTIWCWDEQREVWSSDWTYYARDPNCVVAIPSTTYQGPVGTTGGSNAPTVTIVPLSSLTTLVSGSVAVTDITAATELWIDKGSGFVLDQTLLAGVTNFAIGSLLPATAYPVRARQVKGAINGAYSATVTAHTLLEVPTVALSGAGRTGFRLAIGITRPGQGLVIQRNSVTIQTYTSVAPGVLYFNDSDLTCATGYAYEVFTQRTDWPVGIRQSDIVTKNGTTGACGGPN